MALNIYPVCMVITISRILHLIKLKLCSYKTVGLCAPLSLAPLNLYSMLGLQDFDNSITISCKWNDTLFFYACIFYLA